MVCRREMSVITDSLVAIIYSYMILIFMDAKKLFAILAVAVMLIAPAACVFTGEAQADSTSNGELKEGIHIHLKDLDELELASLFEGKSTNGESESGSEMAYLFAFVLPGINAAAFEKSQPVKDSLKANVSSLDIDVSHYVSDDKTKMTMKIAAKADVKNLEITIKLPNDLPEHTKVLIEPQSKITEEQTNGDDSIKYIQQYTFRGDYAEKMKKDFDGKEFTAGQELTFTLSGVIEAYAESSFELFKGANDVLYFKNGGYIVPVSSESTNDSSFSTMGSLPVTKVEAKADITGKTKMFDKDVEIKENIDLRLSCDYKREYSAADKDVTNGTVYRDKFTSTPQAYLKHSISYNGATNGTPVNIDFSNILSVLADGQYFKIDATAKGKNIDYFAQDYALFKQLVGNGENQANYASIIMAAQSVSTDPAVCNEKAKELMNAVGAKEGSDGYSMSYDDANRTADSIKSSIEGGSSDNTMMIVGIVIAVIVVLALIALWYFKFRPTPEAKTEEPKNESQ